VDRSASPGHCDRQPRRDLTCAMVGVALCVLMLLSSGSHESHLRSESDWPHCRFCICVLHRRRSPPTKKPTTARLVQLRFKQRLARCGLGVLRGKHMPIESWLRNTALRLLVRQLVESGRLPVMLPRQIAAGYGSGRLCCACDEPITSTQVEYEVDDYRDGGRLCFHRGCHMAWQLECARGPFKTASH
jgi:hypothetical protein